MADDARTLPQVTLKRLSQVAAVAASSRLEDTIDWLLPMLTYYGQRSWQSSDDWFDEIKSAYGIEVPLHDIGESISRLRGSGILIWKASEGEFKLARGASVEIESKIELAADIEERVKSLWFDAVADRLPAGWGPKDGWELLMDYCAPVFRAHGMDAISVITEDAPASPDETHGKMLANVFSSHSIPEVQRAGIRSAIATFFNSQDTEITAYIAQLADSTFNLLALCVDDDSRRSLRQAMPQLKVFVDTNILFSLLGTHDTPLAAASIDLFRVIKSAKLPFKIYYHEKTLSELTHTIDDASYRLRRQTWAPNVSKAITEIPWRVTRVSGIEMRFHQLNAEKPIDPVAFCARYETPAALLAEYGLKIYREPDVQDGPERLELRSTMIADYKEYLSRNPRRRNSNYVKLDHDCSVWMIAKDHQMPNRKGIIFSGAFFLSSDYVLWRFDREIMRLSYSSRPVVVLPDAFLQSLRPFLGGAIFDDRAFVQAFSSSEFRAAGSASGNAPTVQRVMSYLAAFEDLPTETAIRILTDNILLEGLRRYEESAPEFTAAIEKAIFAHNEMLVRDRDELLQERKAQLELAQRALGTASADFPELRESLTALVDSLKGSTGHRPQIVNNYGGVVNTEAGGVYNNERSQIAGQGPAASATGNEFTMQAPEIRADPLLIAELIEVKKRLVVLAESAGDYEAIAGVQGAIESLQKDETAKAPGFLRRAGQKALDAAIDVGAKAAAALIQAQIGA